MEKPRNIYLPFIPTGKTAITIFPFIFWSRKKKGWLRPEIIIHEMYHWNEQNDWKQKRAFGVLQWLVKYILLWFWFNLIKGLRSQEHPMEKPAYKEQYNSI